MAVRCSIFKLLLFHVLVVWCGAKHVALPRVVIPEDLNREVQDSIRNLVHTGIYSHLHLDPAQVQVITPTKVTRDGTLVSHVLDHMHEHGHARARRAAVEQRDQHEVHYNLTLDGKEIRLDLRQTLVFSSVALPEIKSVMNRKCQNYAGKVVVGNPVDAGSIQQVILQVPQIFHRFNATSPLQSVSARFDYFLKEVLPKQRDPLMGHTLIYVPSYFDYVRVRNHFKKEDIGFVQICEYSKDAKIARARDMFFHSEAHFMLYSERVHFFRRFRVKGIRHVIFYQPPAYPHFYAEICNLMQESNQNKYGGSECNMTVSLIYCQYDLPRVAAILGTRRASRMAASDKHQHMYMTGE